MTWLPSRYWFPGNPRWGLPNRSSVHRTESSAASPRRYRCWISPAPIRRSGRLRSEMPVARCNDRWSPPLHEIRLTYRRRRAPFRQLVCPGHVGCEPLRGRGMDPAGKGRPVRDLRKAVRIPVSMAKLFLSAADIPGSRCGRRVFHLYVPLDEPWFFVFVALAGQQQAQRLVPVLLAPGLAACLGHPRPGLCRTQLEQVLVLSAETRVRPRPGLADTDDLGTCLRAELPGSQTNSSASCGRPSPPRACRASSRIVTVTQSRYCAPRRARVMSRSARSGAISRTLQVMSNLGVNSS